jgi:hypothetical protein
MAVVVAQAALLEVRQGLTAGLAAAVQVLGHQATLEVHLHKLRHLGLLLLAMLVALEDL